MRGWGGHVWQGGVCSDGRRAWRGGMRAPQTLRDMVRQCAAGTHPTGMHSFKQFYTVLKTVTLTVCEALVKH